MSETSAPQGPFDQLAFEITGLREKAAHLESQLLAEREQHYSLKVDHAKLVAERDALRARLEQRGPIDATVEQFLKNKLAHIRFVNRLGRAGVKLMLRGRPTIFASTLGAAGDEAVRRWGGNPLNLPKPVFRGSAAEVDRVPAQAIKRDRETAGERLDRAMREKLAKLPPDALAKAEKAKMEQIKQELGSDFVAAAMADGPQLSGFTHAPPPDPAPPAPQVPEGAGPPPTPEEGAQEAPRTKRPRKGPPPQKVKQDRPLSPTVAAILGGDDDE